MSIALACQGLMRAAADGRRGPESRRAVRRIASDFSRTIRRYSAGEQVPQAIIIVRRAIVSRDARLSSIIFGARKTGSKSFDCLVLRRFTSALTHVALDGARRQTNQRRSIALLLLQPETEAVHDPPSFRDGHVSARTPPCIGGDDRLSHCVRVFPAVLGRVECPALAISGRALWTLFGWKRAIEMGQVPVLGVLRDGLHGTFNRFIQDCRLIRRPRNPAPNGCLPKLNGRSYGSELDD